MISLADAFRASFVQSKQLWVFGVPSVSLPKIFEIPLHKFKMPFYMLPWLMDRERDLQYLVRTGMPSSIKHGHVFDRRMDDCDAR